MNATHDDLTGLHNRRGFFLALRRQVGYVNEKRGGLALLIVDIGGFKAMNNTHGYEFGDLVLQHVGTLIGRVARAHDFAARIGDNRFALILPGIMNRGHAELAIQKLFRLLDLPFEARQGGVKIGVTVGAALCPINATHADTLVQLAERAVIAARSNREPYAFAVDSSLRDNLSEYWDMEIELSNALARGELVMHYQPKVDCRTRKPVGAEALMRWTSRTRGPVSPDLFIPVAERTGQIKPLTLWALNTALRQASDWKHEFGDLSVAVNVSADLVAHEDLADIIGSALNLWVRDHVNLTLEITERSLVVSPESSFNILSRIRDMGVKVSIDDFGTGYSCLAYFRNIPADELKIDKSFVSALLTEPACAEISHLIIDLAHRFGMSVVAEGIEDEATLEFLQEAHCDIAQGYLLGKPMSSEDFQRWLDAAGGVESMSEIDMVEAELRSRA